MSPEVKPNEMNIYLIDNILLDFNIILEQSLELTYYYTTRNKFFLLVMFSSSVLEFTNYFTNGKVNFSGYESTVSMLVKFSLCYDEIYVKLKAVSTEWPDPYESLRT